MQPPPPVSTVSLDVDKEKEGEKKAEDDKYAKFPRIGVEPIMFLYMMGYRVIYVVEEAFFLYKACTVDLAFPLHVCQHITQPIYKNYSAEVQIKVSSFHQFNNAGLLALPAVLIIFLGAWSDRVGRKVPLLLGLIGYFVHALMMAIISINDKWNLESVLYGATIPGSLTGRDWTIYMACFSYLSDTTSPTNRTLRSTFLAVAYLIPIPLGVALGSYLYNGPLEGSFFALFLTTAGILALAVLYTVIFIPCKTFEASDSSRKVCSLAPIIDTFNTLVQPRKDRRRLLLFLALVAIALSVIVKDESKMIQLYTFWKFNWNVKIYSIFKTFEATSFVIGLLICAPLIQKYFKLQDAYILIFGASSFLISRIIFAFSHTPLWIYIGAAFSFTGPIISPVGRSIVSKVVHVSDRGKMFALVGVFELSARFLASVAYSQVYIHTIKTTFPEAFFLVTILCQAIIVLIGLYIHFSILDRKNIGEESEKKN